jgi:hypothetical protein
MRKCMRTATGIFKTPMKTPVREGIERGARKKRVKILTLTAATRCISLPTNECPL